MMYREIISVCSETHIKHINTKCGQNMKLLNVKQVVHIVTTGLQTANEASFRKFKVIKNNHCCGAPLLRSPIPCNGG
jgi:hypothetical protein